MWVYVIGSLDGGTIKIGHTNRQRIIERRKELDGDMNGDDYVLLAGLHSSATGEDIAHRYFEEWRQPRGKYKEYYNPAEPLVEWVLWLRQQWFTCFDITATQNDAYETHPDEWVPKPGRREHRPPHDPDKLVQDSEQLQGPLAGTAWSWMPDLTASFQDYFTPPELVQAASDAMGGIDLDAASHWIANRRLREHNVIVDDYYHVNKSAFDHQWKANVWLNPPYKNNAPWFNRAVEMMDTGQTEQLCMLSPVYVFSTKIARPIMERAAAAVLLTPTPKFYNPGDPTKTGTNLPHAIVYWGNQRARFLAAYAEHGIPFQIAWDDLPPPVPDKSGQVGQVRGDNAL